MKIDPEKVKKLVSLPDKELWQEIRRAAAENGLNLPDTPPTHGELERLRGAVNDVGRVKIAEALRVLADYKRRTRE